MYIAMKYIGRDYTPGEILPDDLPEKDVKWLLEAGAIVDTASTINQIMGETAQAVDTVQAETVKVAEEPQAAQAASATSTVQAVEPPEDMEPDAPVIDAMDGVTTSKPAKKRGKKK